MAQKIRAFKINCRYSHLAAIPLIVLSINVYLAGQTWNPDASPTRQNLARLDMLSDTLGYAVSYDGLLLKYNGRNWAIFDSISSIKHFFNEQSDSLLPMNNDLGDIYTIRIKKETQGWLAINNAERNIFQLFSFNPKNKSYQLHNLPLKVRALDFNDREQGIAVGEGGAYEYDGDLWKIINLPVSVDFKMIHFIDNEKAVICGEKGVILIKNKDEWKQIENDLDVILRDADFISEDEGWFVGYDGIILHYKNGYLEQELAETTENLWAVDMLSEDYGFAVGTNGTILQYNGIYWDIFPYNPQVDLHDLEMISSNDGFALGARGTILHFSEESIETGLSHKFLFADQVHLGSEYLMDRIDDVRGITAADFNNDNNIDLYLTCYRSLNHLLLNQGQGYFRDFVIESGTGGNIETRVGKQKYEFGSLAADFDRDGDTDLFLAGKRKTSRYFVNKGNAVFVDETELCGLPQNLEIIDGSLADLNIDGYPDLVLADENEGLLVFLNKKYNRFSLMSGLPEKVKRSGIQAAKVCDLNNDNFQDILVVFQHLEPVPLINDQKDDWYIPDQTMFRDFSSDFINSVSVGDINCDGYSDFFFCTEDGQDAVFIYDEPSQNYLNLSEAWKVKKGGRSYSAAIADFDMNGTQDIFVSRYGSDLLYINHKNQFFTDQAQEFIYSKSGYLSGYNTGVSIVDLEKNGTYDLVVGNADYWSSLLQNQTTKPSLIKVNLEGIKDTKEGLGAKIWLRESNETVEKAGILSGYIEILPNAGLFSQNEINPVFAVSPGLKYNLEVRFLNGDTQQFSNLESGDEVQAIQSSGIMRLVIYTGRRFLQFLHIPYIGWELFKFILFIIIILVSVRFVEQRYEWKASHTVFYVGLILPFYILITYLLRNVGIIYHFLPFTIIGFVLLLLVVINEPIRRSNQIIKRRQEKVNQAGMQLSRTYNDDDALSIVINTLKIIQPFKQLAIYLYQPSRNYLKCHLREGISENNLPTWVSIRKEIIESISRETSLIPEKMIPDIFPGIGQHPDHLHMFSLVRKKVFLGLVILGPDESEMPVLENWEGIRYLFLQLAIALDNIRIIENLQEQEKIGAIGTFAGGIIHNLKNPVDGLRIIIELLYNEMPETDPHYEHIEELYNGILKLKKQLMRSFEFSMNRDQMNEVIDVIPWITEIINGFSSAEGTFDLISQVNTKTRIKGDREQLGFAIENIMQNALEASENHNPVQISIKMKPEDQSVVIRISDSGAGIPDHKIDKIFEMFYSTRGVGRGLGLTITKNIISKHNGTIEVESSVNKGSTFTLTLPILKSEGDNE